MDCSNIDREHAFKGFNSVFNQSEAATIIRELSLRSGKRAVRENSGKKPSFCDIGNLIINQLLKVHGSVGFITRLMKSVPLAGWVNVHLSKPYLNFFICF